MKIISPPALNKYSGNKGADGCYQKIINLIPPIQGRYIEPFAGSAKIAAHLRPAQLTILNDLDPAVIRAWRSTPQTAEIKLFNLTWFQLLEAISPQADDFIYADPPYVFKARRNQKPLYNFEMCDDDHYYFLKYIRTVKSNCMISNYPNEIYDSILHDWNRIEFKVMTHQGPAIEVLWMNYKTPETLHDYKFVGADCWDRQGIKRKITRLSNKLKALPPLERNAIINRVFTS